jgi:alanine racemase
MDGGNGDMRSILSARPAWVEINLDHIEHNIRELRRLIGPITQIMAVVKADGYGHGAAAVSEAALKGGAGSLAVAFVEEAVELRRAGITAPILILGYTDPAQFSTLVRYKLTPTVFSFDTASRFSALAVENNVHLPLHLKVDTGMGRIGLLPEEVVGVVSRIIKLPGLSIEGIFTHLAAAEEFDQSYTGGQLRLFDRVIDRCLEKGIVFPLIHAANSAAAILTPSARYNLIRLGIALYGCYPSPGLDNGRLNLLPALTFKSRVVMVKEVPPGTSISYGCTYRTDQDTLIATIPVGYADGYSRLLSNRGHVLIRGVRAPVVGRICMDHLMADVSAIPGADRGDEVVIYGKQGAEDLKVEEAAGQIGTINYELLCAIDKRVPRFYFQDGKLASVHDFMQDSTF